MPERLTTNTSPAHRLALWVDRWRWAWFTALGLLYLAGYQTHWRIYPDSALYVQLARNISEGRGYIYHHLPHDLAYPMMPWLLSAVWSLFGVGNWAVVNALILGMGILALALSYRAVKRCIDRPTATVVTLLTGTMCVVYYYVFVPQTDVLFFLGVAAVLAGYEGVIQKHEAQRDREPVGEWLVLGLGLWVAITSRPTMWALVLAIAGTVAVCVMRGRQRTRHLIIAAMTGACLLGFYLLDPRPEMRYVKHYASVAGDAPMFASRMYNSLTWWFESQTIPRLIGVGVPEVAQPFIGGALWLGLFLASAWLVCWRWLWGLFAMATVAMVLWHVPSPRYFIPVMPLLLVVGWTLIVWLSRISPQRWAMPAVALILVLWLIPNGLLIGRLIARQHREPFLADHFGGQFYGLPELARRVNETVPKRAWVVARDHSRVLTWYAQRSVCHARVVKGIHDWHVRGRVSNPRVVAALRHSRVELEPLPLYWLTRGRDQPKPTWADAATGGPWRRVWQYRLPDGQLATLWRWQGEALSLPVPPGSDH